MIGAPFDTGTWNGVEAGYYTGMGGGEMTWLIISIIMCVVALIIGSRHELSAYRKVESEGAARR